MALSKDDLKAIKEIVSDSQVELAAIVNSAFEKQQKYFDDRMDRFEETQANHTQQHEKVEETLQDHTQRFTRIERKQDAGQWLSDNHDRRISRLEKQQGLKPLPQSA